MSDQARLGAYLDADEARQLATLAEFVAFASISSDPAAEPAIAR